MDGQEMTGRGGIRFKLVPKPAHVRIHRSGIGVAIVAPRGIQDCVPVQRTIDILNEEQQQIILGGRYFHYFTATHYPPAADIDRHVGEANDLVGRIVRSAVQDRVDGRNILVLAGWFGWVVDYDEVIHLRQLLPFDAVCNNVYALTRDIIPVDP
jgi:hypothetical protein